MSRLSVEGHEGWEQQFALQMWQAGAVTSALSLLLRMPRVHAAKLQETLQKSNATRLLLRDCAAFNIQMVIFDG